MNTNPFMILSDVESMLNKKITLFNIEIGVNFIFHVKGLHLDEKSISDINKITYHQQNKIGERFNAIEALGGEFVFNHVDSEMLELNLRLIDGDLPEILAYMLKMRFQKGISKLDALVSELETTNPMGYNQKHKHPFYRYKITKFLYNSALGMTPESFWNGEIKANGGIIVVKNDGDVLAYHTYYKSKFEDYLLNNTFLEQASTSEDPANPGTAMSKETYPSKNIKPFKFGWLYLENNILKMKVNLQVRFLK